MTMSSTNQSGASPTVRFMRRHRDILLLAGLFALVLAGLASLAAATGWAETMQQIGKLTFLQILILLGLSLINYGFRGLRWHLFARRLGLPTKLIQDMRHFLGGFAMSVTPGRVGELIRMRWLRRETGWSVERTAPLVLMDRASDLGAIALILALSITLSAAGIAGAVPVTLMALIAAYVATRPQLLAGIALGAYRLSGVWPRLFGRIRTASRSLARFSDAKTMLAAAALGLIGWMAEGYAFYILLMWMGADIGFWTAIAIFVFSTLAGGLTGAPGGVGGAEAAMIGLLMIEHVPLDMSVPATLLIRLTTLWFAIGIGFAVFPFAERISLKGRHALENR
jgi:uncharacterized protein (TIRG00374 family)